MYAVKVDGVNFWEETPAAGKQIHKSFTNVESDINTNAEQGKSSQTCRAGFTEYIDWVDSKSELLLKECRIIEVFRSIKPKTLLPNKGMPEN